MYPTSRLSQPMVLSHIALNFDSELAETCKNMKNDQ